MRQKPFKTTYLTIGYITALSFVAILSISGYMLVRKTIALQDTDARIINLSGRQRMLSQMLTKEALLLAQYKDTEEKRERGGTLRQALAGWEKVHNGLRYGNAELRLPGNNGPEIQDYFSRMEPHYRKICEGIREVLSNVDGGETVSPVSGPLREIVENSPLYLKLMDKAVFQYQKEADGRVAHLKSLETCIIILILTLLTLEAAFIFRPMVKKVRASYEGFHQANSQLEREVTERRCAEEALRAAKADLEGQVRERTLGLTASNEQLKNEVLERKRAEETLQKAYREKELLLHEIHHRVKNNMQVITSLLRLQAGGMDDPKYLAIFRESENRIKSMSLVHERLYRSGDLSSIGMKEYINDLVRGLTRSYGIDAERIRFELKIGDITLGIGAAIPCGLIINELVTNSLKHAFPDGRRGIIGISFFKNSGDEMELVIHDNGIGLPQNPGSGKAESLGLELVNILVNDQLEGRLETRSTGNTELRIVFRETPHKERM